MSLVSAAYYSDSEEGDSESDRELIEDKVQNHISSLPDLPDKIINRFNKPPVLDHLSDRMYRSPVSKTTCFMFFQVRLDSKQYQLLDIVLNDVNSVMNAYKLKNFEPLHRGKLGTIKPLHVSLTSSLNFANRADLNASIAQIKKDIAALKVKSIPISLSGNWCLYENFDASLSFLTLNLAQPSRRQLEPVLDVIRNNLPSTISSAVVKAETAHISFGVAANSITDSKGKDAQKLTESTKKALVSEASSHIPHLRSNLLVRCDEFKAEVGLDVISIPF